MTNLFSIFDRNFLFFRTLNFFNSFFYVILLRGGFWMKSSYSLNFNWLGLIYIYNELRIILIKNLNSAVYLVGSIIFIIFLNIFRLLPWVFSATSHIRVTLLLSLFLWWGPQIYAALTSPDKVLAHIVPTRTPWGLIPLLVLIEFVSSNIRPFTLAIRLAANITAGHLILGLIRMNCILQVRVAGLIMVSLCMLEIGVSFIQAYVFVLLSTLYSQELED